MKRFIVFFLLTVTIIAFAGISLAQDGAFPTRPHNWTDTQRFRGNVEFNSLNDKREQTVQFGANSETSFNSGAELDIESGATANFKSGSIVLSDSGATTTFSNVPYFAAGFKRDVVVIDGIEDLSAWASSGGSYFQTVVGKTYLVNLTSIATKQNAANQWGSATTGITIFSAVTAVLPFCDDSWDSDQTITIIHADSATTPVQVWAGIPSGTTEYNKEAHASLAQNLEVTWSTTTITSGISDWSLNGAQEFATWTLYCSNVANDPTAGVSAYKTQARYIAW